MYSAVRCSAQPVGLSWTLPIEDEIFALSTHTPRRPSCWSRRQCALSGRAQVGVTSPTVAEQRPASPHAKRFAGWSASFSRRGKGGGQGSTGKQLKLSPWRWQRGHEVLSRFAATVPALGLAPLPTWVRGRGALLYCSSPGTIRKKTYRSPTPCICLVPAQLWGGIPTPMDDTATITGGRRLTSPTSETLCSARRAEKRIEHAHITRQPPPPPRPHCPRRGYPTGRRSQTARQNAPTQSQSPAAAAPLAAKSA